MGRSPISPRPPPRPPPPPGYGCIMDPQENEYIRINDNLRFIKHFEHPVSLFEQFYECLAHKHQVSNLTMTNVSHREYYDKYFLTSSYSDVRKYNFTLETYNVTYTKNVYVAYTSGEGLSILIIFAYVIIFFCCIIPTGIIWCRRRLPIHAEI